MAADEHSTSAVIAAFCANLGIAVAKFVGFVVHRLGRRCSPRPCTRWPTPATRRLLLLGGASAANAGRRRCTRSATAASATSGRSSCPLRAVHPRRRCSRIYEGIEKLLQPARARVGRLGASASCWSPSCSSRSRSAPRCARAARRRRARSAWWRFIRRSEGARAAGRAARGPRRADRPRRSRSSASASRRSPATPRGTRVGSDRHRPAARS